jgi:hypothetical protein
MWSADGALRLRLDLANYQPTTQHPGCRDVALALADVQALADAGIRLVEHVRRHCAARAQQGGPASPPILGDPFTTTDAATAQAGVSRAVDDARRTALELISLEIDPGLVITIRVHGTDGVRSAIMLLLRSIVGAQQTVQSLAIETSDVAWLAAFNGQFAAVVGASLEAVTSGGVGPAGELNPVTFESLTSLRRLAAAVRDVAVVDADANPPRH